MLYFGTSIILVNVFLLLKKFEEKQNLCRSLARSVVLYECYLCLIAGIMTVIHIPVNTYSISIINIISIICILLILHKKRVYQRYYIDYWDILFIVLLAVVVIWVFMKRFSMNLNIIFETPDPGNHLYMAMKFVNNQAVDDMYIAQLLNGLLIESLSKIYSGEMVYKSFIIQCGINLFVAGTTFWSVIQKYEKNKLMRIVVYALTVAYILGYPLNDFYYGFVYLQMTITVVCFLISLMHDFVYQNVNIWLWGMLIGAACLSVGIGYTMFAPPVYLSVLGMVLYKAYQEKWLVVQKEQHVYLSRRFILCVLNIFLIPTFLTLWIIIIMPRLNGVNVGVGIEIGNNLAREGAIYRNLYSDFLLFIVPAIYGIYSGFKKKKLDFLSLLYVVFGIYYIFIFILMLLKYISTYYFYKLNFLLWMLVLIAFVTGIKELWKREKSLCVMLLSVILVLTGVYSFNVEKKFQEKNMLYLPISSTDILFRIYYSNSEIFKLRSAEVSKDVVDVCHIVREMDMGEPICLVMNPVSPNYHWCQALTNKSFIGFSSYKEFIDGFKTGNYGGYAIIEKNIEDIEIYRQSILEYTVVENKYAYIIKKN